MKKARMNIWYNYNDQIKSQQNMWLIYISYICMLFIGTYTHMYKDMHTYTFVYIVT